MTDQPIGSSITRSECDKQECMGCLEHTAGYGRTESLEGFQEEGMPATELNKMGLLG